MISLGYLSVILVTVLVRSEDFKKLELNALGDFLSGTFAPLALLWLVIGYFQQGDELRQNSRALRLQAEELRQAAEHAGGLLDVARKEHELATEKLRAEQCRHESQLEREAQTLERKRKQQLQPDLSFHLAFVQEGDEARVKLVNSGHDCTDFTLEIPDNDVLRLLESVHTDSLKSHASLFFRVAALKRLGTTKVFTHWTDHDGDRFQLEFIASVADDLITIRN